MTLTRRRVIQIGGTGATYLATGAKAANDAINAAGFEHIGGIDQWIAVQGQNASNPVILYLHGGPGEAQSPFLKEFLPWEKDFTVVNWDQRGSGKTFGRNGAATPDMTLDQLVDDAAEIAQLICGRLSQRKVILVGQSWGSFLGVNVIKRHPNLFHAYVGTGQMVSFIASAAEQAQWARAQASKVNDQATLAALNKAAFLPQPDKGSAQAKASRKYLISSSDGVYASMVHEFMGADLQAAKGDAADWIAGADFSGSKLGQVIETLDLNKLGLDMPVPFFVVQGREDHIAGFESAKAYVEDIRAPAKAFVPVEGGHYACFTNPDAFVGFLRERVRPLAT